MSEQTMGQEQKQSQGPAEGSRLGQGAENRQTAEATSTPHDRGHPTGARTPRSRPRPSATSAATATAATSPPRAVMTMTEDQSSEDDRRSAEEFAAEHDPEKHDIAAGEELRQRGDWTADDTGGPQVWDAEGHLVDGAGPGSGDAQTDGSGRPRGPRPGRSRWGAAHLEHRGVRDGGYGVGSAAPLEEGAVPFGHPVKAWNDTRTFVDTDHPRYDDAEPHVWFTDPEAAQQAGFRRAGD